MSDFYSANYVVSSSTVALKNMQVPLYDLFWMFSCVGLYTLIYCTNLLYHDSGWKRDLCFICKFERLIQKGHETNSPVSPVGLLSQIQSIGREEDAHEFLRPVFDASFFMFEYFEMNKAYNYHIYVISEMW